MPLYWLVYRHNNSIFVVIEPGASIIHDNVPSSAGLAIGSGPKRLLPFVPLALPSQIIPTNSAIGPICLHKFICMTCTAHISKRMGRNINPSSHHPEMSKSCSLFVATASQDTVHNKCQSKRAHIPVDPSAGSRQTTTGRARNIIPKAIPSPIQYFARFTRPKKLKHSLTKFTRKPSGHQHDNATLLACLPPRQ